MPKPEGYGIIYNWDGGPHGYSEVPQSMEVFLEKTFAPLEDTQVGALFWCVGEHSARWDSEVLEQVGDVHGRQYENAQIFTITENIRLMLERGDDPQKALVERGHQLGLQVYASVRMNDNHFNGAQLEDLNNLHHTELTRMRIEHPEWLLGPNAASDWFALSWNFAVPEVREHRLEHIREICTRYDWDGVELDWQRHAFHLPHDHAYRLRYALTDLQRAVRQMTEGLARERGRPFHVAARVAPCLETCFKIGYDIPNWIDEGLVDILIPAANAGTDPSVDVSEFVDLCRDSEVVVYPGLDSGLPDPFVGPEDVETKEKMRTRAITSGYHQAGADGIYVFNWHANRDSRRELLLQVGSAETLRGTDKIYAATHRFMVEEGAWRGAYRPDRIYGEVPVPLKLTLSGDGPVIMLEIADEFSENTPEKLELRVRVDQWVKGDSVTLCWDGDRIENPEVRYCMIHDHHRIGAVSGAVWLCASLNPAEIDQGPHQVKVILNQRHPQLACDMVLTDVELVLMYRSV